MTDRLLAFYRQPGLSYLWSALQGVVGRPPEYARDQRLYRTHVIDQGWQGLPEAMQALGRQALQWNEILLVLRREIYSVQNGRLTFRADALARLDAGLRQVLGSTGAHSVQALEVLPVELAAPDGPSAQAPMMAGPGDAALDNTIAQWVFPGSSPETPSGPASASAVAAELPTAPVKTTSRPARAAPRPAEPPTVPLETVSTASVAVPTQPTAGSSDLAAEERAAPPGLALGIDLGTTYSVVAYLDAQGRPISIPNSAGDLLTPSVVLFEDEGVVVGKEAVQAAAMEPDRVADCVKRDMGARAYRKAVTGRELPPEVISAFILRSLRADSERRLGSIHRAVITVPAYFDELRRRATMDAGRLAGLEVLDIINEPTAAAIAYGYQLGFLDRQGQVAGDQPVRVLVFDLGGGTFDVTILDIRGTAFKALATDGDIYLGGKDWDEKLIELAAERFRAEFGSDPRQDPAAAQELWVAVESAKRTLSERPRAPVYLNLAGRRLKVELTRDEFEAATTSLLGRTQTTTEIVLRQAGLTWSDIDRVLLVGGSTRMPMVRRMLEKVTGKRPEQSISPDEAVAHGAALYADLLLHQRAESAGEARFSITNVNSHSLGIIGIDPQTKQRRNQVLIPKNTPLPCSVTRVFKTSHPGQSMVTIRVMEGESERPDACTQVGVCTIRDLPPDLPLGWPVQVSYAYEENGRLRVLAKLEGLPAVVTTYFLRDNSLPETDLRRWESFVSAEWGRKNEREP
jgi:molecular chaperone DnaK